MAEAYALDLDCEFGGVSIGDTTARVGVKLTRENLDLHEADGFFAGRRLECEISLLNRMDRGQKRLPSMEDDTPPSIEAQADCKGYRVDAKKFGASLTFALDSIDVTELAQFAKSKGTVRANVVGDLADEPDEDEDDAESSGDDIVTQERTKGGRHVTKRTPAKVSVVKNDAGAEQPMKALVDFGLPSSKCKAVAASVGPTIGHLEKKMREDAWWHRNIKGIGKEYVDRVTDALTAFRRANPVPSEDEPEPQGDEGTVLDPAVAGAE